MEAVSTVNISSQNLIRPMYVRRSCCNEPFIRMANEDYLLLQRTMSGHPISITQQQLLSEPASRPHEWDDTCG
jgi:hypothetical protein